MRKSEIGNLHVACHVTFKDSKIVVSTEQRNLLESIRTRFGIKSEAIRLQIFQCDWNEWVDVVPEDVPNRSKLKVLTYSEPQNSVGPSSSRLQNQVPEESSSGVEPTDTVEGAKLPGSPGSSLKKKITFSNIEHPLLTKLRGGNRLDRKETTELVKKIFHVITEHTFFPTTHDLVSYVKKLLLEFPVLKEGNYQEAKKRWTSLLQKKFCLFRSEVVKREQKPKCDQATQTDNESAFQDMSPIMLSIKQEYLKPKPDEEKIKRFMCLTYPYRRAFIINMVPKVMAVQEMYPALFQCDEVCREFLRITGKENDQMFLSNLENYGHIVYNMTKPCSAKHIVEVSIKNAKDRNAPYVWRNAALLLLPHLFTENHNFLWFENNQRFDAEQTEPYIKCSTTMKGVAEGRGFFQVYAENIFLAQTGDFAVAVECFLASFFIFLIEYRADLKHTLQLLQSFFFEYDDPLEEELHPRVVEVADMLKLKMKRQNQYVMS